MTVFLCILAFFLGVLVGRLYSWMKYHYPEFQEKVKLEAARYRLQRARCEAETEKYKSAIDDDLDRRLGR